MAKKIVTSTEIEKKVTFNPDPRIHVVFSRTIQIGEEWNKAEAGMEINIESIEDAESAYEKAWEIVGGQVDTILGEEHPEEETEEEETEEEETEEKEETEEEETEETEETEEEEEEETEEEEEEETEEDEDGEEEEISEEDINTMSKSELVSLCEDTEGLEGINTKLKLKALRKEIIEALFEEEEKESEEDWEDTDWEE